MNTLAFRTDAYPCSGWSPSRFKQSSFVHECISELFLVAEITKLQIATLLVRCTTIFPGLNFLNIAFFFFSSADVYIFVAIFVAIFVWKTTRIDNLC